MENAIELNKEIRSKLETWSEKALETPDEHTENECVIDYNSASPTERNVYDALAYIYSGGISFRRFSTRAKALMNDEAVVVHEQKAFSAIGNSSAPPVAGWVFRMRR